MSRYLIIAYILLLCIMAPAMRTAGQEFTGPIRYNPFLGDKASVHKMARKTTATLSLPFFEDFTGYGIYPDSSKWTDYEVYINNTMCVSPVCRGVATFDDLDRRGIPYDSFSNTAYRYADSLTSQPIDLSGASPGDSLYLSFFYQPQGNGFYPMPSDSLMLYMKTVYGGYVKVWTVPGSHLQPFRQVMVPIVDSFYFHSGFQFRFVNKAALYWADAIWNLDYIRLDKFRFFTDTQINDIGYSSDPNLLLNDYTSMPYRQFYANPAGETVSSFFDSIHNNYIFPQTVNQIFTAKALNTGTVLQSPAINSPIIAPGVIGSVVTPAYTTSIPLSSVGIYDKVVFENKYYFDQVSTSDPLDNDTVVKDQVFDNYLAYDDGSAEKSYYLTLFPTLPGRIAVEYHLNQPDTMRGLAIYFGRQIPFAFNKYFSIIIYSALAGVNGAPQDDTLYTQDYLTPGYADTVNHFWIYRFDTPLPLPAGTFFAGTMQPAESGSDSLYIGLDVNRVGGNHAYYNVLSSWNPSLISGALMIRPLLGQYVPGTSVTNTGKSPLGWGLSPNPAGDAIQIDAHTQKAIKYHITDVYGHTVLQGSLQGNTNSVDISGLAPGVYFASLIENGVAAAPRKFVKL